MLNTLIFRPVIKDEEVPVDYDDKISHPHGYITSDDVS
jgi:hypothetical protein